MTPEEEALERVIDLLERLRIPYMVTGSIAASYHGRPRATHDADVVIDPAAGQLDELTDSTALGGGSTSMRTVRGKRCASAISSTPSRWPARPRWI